MAQTARAKSQQEIVDSACRNAIIDECANCVPTNWLDSLLTGPNKVIDKSPPREIEALLRGVQDRIRALKANQ